jgi:hypothetical protein
VPISDWSGFFSANVGASAALVGLVTVAISINLTRILAFEHLPARAGESLWILTAVLAICEVALFPRISQTAFGAVALALAVVSLVFAARNQWAIRTFPDPVAINRQIIGAMTRLASSLPIGVGGALLLLHAPEGMTWIAAGVVLSLAVSVMNAWVLLVEIIR